jgi:Holliday junction resolvase RusA-like endonuclease
MIKITVPGNPMGKQRPRVMRSGFTYTPKKTVNYETQIRERFAASFPNHTPISEAVRMELKIFMYIPKSTSQKKLTQMINREIRPTKKPDIDNIVKVVADALNGIAYADDKQIVSLVVEKYYSVRPRVEIGVGLV